jgi:hypothetical protein
MATSSRHRAPVRSARRRGANPPVGQGRYQRHELAAVAGGIVLVVVIAVLSGWAHYSLSAVRPASPHAAAAAPASGLAPPPLTVPPSPPMRAWFNEAKPSIDALVVAGDEIVAAATQGDMAATGAACRTAAGAVANLQEHLPSPDPALNTALQQAITNYQVGIRYCISGTHNQDAVKIGEAKVYIDQGNTDLRTAVDIIESDLSSEARGTSVLTV